MDPPADVAAVTMARYGQKVYEIDASITKPFRLSARSLARAAHTFACSALLASLARSAALIRSLARSLTHSGAHGKEVHVYELNASISCNFGP